MSSTKHLLKAFLSSFRYFLTDSRYRKIQLSGLFDSFYYLANNSDVQEQGLPPLVHYLQFGSKEGRRPNPLFDPDHYQGQFSEKCSPENLLLHYIDRGIEAGFSPSAYFEPQFYKSEYNYRKSFFFNSSPLAHYLRSGITKGFYPLQELQILRSKPVISLVVPVYNVAPHYLNYCICSVLYQSYPHLELCLADDCSTKEHIRPILRKWAARDKRVKLIFLDKNQGISGATNAAISLAGGEYLGFLDNDDELSPDCLYEVVKQIDTKEADLLYSDEDLIGDDGTRFSIFAKPDFNRELLLNHNYVTHFVTVKRTLYEKVGGLDIGMDGAQDYDLFLKLSEQAENIIHIPKVLYHWRAHETSTSINHQQKDYADEAGKRALKRAMERQGIKADIQATDWKYFYRARRVLITNALVSICIYCQSKTDLLSWLTSLVETANYKHIELVLIIPETLSIDKNSLTFSDLIETEIKLSLHQVPETAVIATAYNRAGQQAEGEYLVFLDESIKELSEGWLPALLEYGQESVNALVGGRLDCSRAGNEEIGTVPDLSNRAADYYFRFLCGCSSHLNGLQSPQNVLALTGELCLLRRDLFMNCNGFDDKQFGGLFWGPDLCLRLRKAGYENVYTPFAKGKRLPATAGKISDEKRTMERKEKFFFQRLYHDLLVQGDPYYNSTVLQEKGVSREGFTNWFVEGGENE